MLKTEKTATIKPIVFERATVAIKGETELIMHKWSEKAIGMIDDNQQGKTRTKKDKKDPTQDYLDSMYTLPDGSPAFPASGFKTAIVDACRMMENLPMVSARTNIFVIGEFIKINGEPRMRRDMVRIGMGTADIRYRAGFPEWSCELTIEYNPSFITFDQLVNLINAAGYGGVGEWRPSTKVGKNGWAGRFRVAADNE